MGGMNMIIRDVEKALQLSNCDHWRYNSLTLNKQALAHVCRRIPAENGACRVLQLGGGDSASFWKALGELEIMPLHTTVVEHHPTRAAEITERLGENPHVDLVTSSLKQITDEEWQQVFDNPAESRSFWPSLGQHVPEGQADYFAIKNAFYSDLDQLSIPAHSVDVLLVDGPHGNGRSLAYPLLADLLKPDALILVDDFDHYPFLPHLGQIYRYEELFREITGSRRWVLVRLQGM
jgi:Methyltransferase domain